jgi:hypothetical protein
VSIHAFMRATANARKRREVADFDSSAPSDAGTSPSGNRTERLKRRVEKLISIWFIAHWPSKSSLTARPRRAREPVGARSRPCRRESRSCPWSGPAVRLAALTPLVALATGRILLQHLAQRLEPGRKAKAIKARRPARQRLGLA